MDAVGGNKLHVIRQLNHTVTMVGSRRPGAGTSELDSLSLNGGGPGGENSEWYSVAAPGKESRPP